MNKYIIGSCIFLLLTGINSLTFGQDYANSKSKQTLAQYDKPVLVTLCENLYAHLDNLNDKFKAVLAQNQQLKKQIKKLKDQNTKLTKQNNVFAHQIAKLIIKNADKKPDTSKNAQQTKTPSKTTSHNNANSSYVPLYHYKYTMTKIYRNWIYDNRIYPNRYHFKNDIYWRDGKFGFHSHFYNKRTPRRRYYYYGSDYDHHHIMFNLYFTNKDTKPYRFQFEVIIHNNQIALGLPTPPAIAGSAVISTPTLQPGETAVINKDISVLDPLSLGKAVLRNVRGFAANN